MHSARHVIKLILNSRLVSQPASYEVAGTIHQSLAGGGAGGVWVRRHQPPGGGTARQMLPATSSTRILYLRLLT